MKLRIFVEPQQGTTYAEQLAVARAAEELGFDAFFRSDHYLFMGTSREPGPTDSWVTLGALARETSTIRLGTLVTSATFRYPGPLAISVAQVDEMSNGRVEFGIGAGWYEEEHKANAIPFPSVGERFARLEEQVEIIHGMWTTPLDSTYSFSGTHYQIVDSPARPKPVQSPPPIILGGAGKSRSAALAARFAAEYNVGFSSVERTSEVFGRVRAAVASSGRAADSMTYSTAHPIVLGSSDAVVARRAAAIGRELDDLRKTGLAGSPTEIVDKIGTYAELGATTFYLQVLDVTDLDHLADIASLVAPQL